jgi:hypothetical protein
MALHRVDRKGQRSRSHSPHYQHAFAEKGETMRRTLLALVLVCGFGLPLATFADAGAQAEATGPVVFTVHAASCPLEDVYSDVGLYDACHANALEGVTFTFGSLEAAPVSFTTDAAGIGAAAILDGSTSVSQVTLSVDQASATDAGGYVYCADQNSGTVLFDGPVNYGDIVPLFTIDNSQAVICDWFIYTDGAPVDEATVAEVANG